MSARRRPLSWHPVAGSSSGRQCRIGRQVVGAIWRTAAGWNGALDDPRPGGSRFGYEGGLFGLWRTRGAAMRAIAIVARAIRRT